jgi:hypothetical protein
MRTCGFILLVSGFLWLMLSALLYPATATSIWSQSFDSLPQRESFSRKEVLDQITGLHSRTSDSQPWVVPPAFLMLFGGILLNRVSTELTRNPKP